MTDVVNLTKKEYIINRLKEKGCRITKQRLHIIDIILENECSCCKEIYIKASKFDTRIGSATVYRFVNTLEEIGAINRKNMYKVAYSDHCIMRETCEIQLDDNTKLLLSGPKWSEVIQAGLKEYGYLKGRNILSVSVRGCDYRQDIS